MNRYLFLSMSLTTSLTTFATSSPKITVIQTLNPQYIEMQDMTEDSDSDIDIQNATHRPLDGDPYTATYHSLDPSYHNAMPHQNPSSTSCYQDLFSILKAYFCCLRG